MNVATRSPAVELAPLRLSAISPGTIDTNAWDGPDEKKASFVASAQADASAMTSTFTTSASPAADDGQPIVQPFRTPHGPRLNSGHGMSSDGYSSRSYSACARFLSSSSWAAR